MKNIILAGLLFVLISEGAICGYTFAAANIDERDVLQDMTQGLKDSVGC